MADRLELEARFKDLASGGVKKLGKTLESVRPSNGMQAANAWMKDFRGEAEKVNKAVQPVTTTLTALGVGGLAASMSLGEIVKQMRNLGDSTLTMKELGRQSGMTMDQIRRLNYAAGQLHVDPSAVTNAIKSWSSQMLEFRTTKSEFYHYLNRNNNSDIAKKIAADSPEQGFKDTLDYLARIPAAAMKAGRSQADAVQIQRQVAEMAGVGDMVPALAKGPEGLRDAMAEAARNVKPMTAEMIAAAERMNISTNRMNQSWDNFKNDIGPTFLDPMSKMIDRLDEVLKGASAAPGDAAALAGVGGMTAAALFARRRIMRNSSTFGGSGLDRAAGELTGAAGALKQAAAALEGGKAVPGSGGAPGEDPKKPGGGSFDKGRGLLAAFGLAGVALNAPAMDEAGDHERDANASALESFGETLKKWTGASWLEGKVDDWRHGGESHPDDDRLSRARPDDMKRDVQEGSKAGIIAGLRELAQQQDLDGKGGDGGPGGTLGAAARVLGKVGIAAGARPRAGGGFTAATGGGITPAKGALAEHQREAYAAAKEAGLSPLAAHALVANMSGEGLANDAHRVHWDGTHNSGGIVQWDPQRAAAIKAHFGKLPWEMGVGEQTKAAIWEIQNNPRFSATAKALKGDNAADMIGALVDNYEVPKYKAKAKAERMGYYRGFNPDAQATPGAGTPAPSAAAVGDAAMFAAKQRLLNGGRDPADRALVDRYKAQQAKPEGHRAGGWIRGAGTGTSDSIPAWLSHGEFVVRAGAAKHWGALLHAINGGHLPAFAEGGEVAAGIARHRSWRSFFRRSPKDGGMGAPEHVALGAMAMMMGESGKWLNPKVYNPNDVDGPSGGSAQWHDVTRGRYAGKIRRLSDLMAFAMTQHADWKDPIVQQAWFRKEATGSMAYAWNAMRRAKTARGALDAGVRRYEVPAHPGLEVLKRMPNIMTLARESGGGRQMEPQSMDPLEVTIRHHPHSGAPIVQARAGRGVRLNIRTGPTMRPT